MPGRNRRIVRAVTRAVAALAVAAVLAVAVAAAALVPWPEHRAEPESIRVAPAESTQQRVCPGPLLTLAEDTLAATTATSVGSADAVTAVLPADVEVTETPVEAPDNPNAAEDGTPVALEVAPGAVDIGFVAGAQSQEAATETLGGLAVAACREPVADAWLVGGSTALGRVTLVLLANPTEVAATVDLRVFGEAGPVDAPSALGILVPPGTQRVVSLAGLAPDLASPVVHVTATGGRIAATLEQTAIDGLVPAGVELVGPAAAPTDQLRIPGVVIVEAGGVAADEDHAEGDAFAALRLLAPGDEGVDVSLSVAPEGLGDSTVIDVSLEPGQVTDVPLGELVPGDYAIDLLADGPIVAAARSSIAPGAPGDPSLDDGLGLGLDGGFGFEDVPGLGGGAGDFAWFPAPSPLIGDVVLAVPDGPLPVLHLAAAGSAATVRISDVSGDSAEQTVEVPIGGAAAVPLEPGASFVLRGADGLVVSISFGDGRVLSSMTIEPPGALDAPIDVYPH